MYKMWWIFLFFRLVYADDDDWDMTIPKEIPITDIGPSFKNTFPFQQQILDDLIQEGSQPSGYYQHKYMDPGDVDEELIRDCYWAGYGPPIKYPHAEDLWDTISNPPKVKSIHAEEVWCSIPYTKFTVKESEVYYSTKLENELRAVKLTMETYHDQNASDGTDRRHVDVHSETHEDDWGRMRMKIYYPFNEEAAREQAIRLVKRAASLNGEGPQNMVEFCRMWNYVSTGGYEFREVPEFDKHKENDFIEIVSQVEGKYPVKVDGVLVDHTNVSTITGMHATYYDRLTCEDYGYESVIDCDDTNLEEMVRLNPMLYSVGTNDLCRTPSSTNVYIKGSGVNTNKLEFGGKQPTIITNVDEISDNKLFCQINHNMKPVFTDHGGGMNYKYQLEQTHNAHMAVMTWAHINCKNKAGVRFDSNAGFSCFLGANKIKMSGGALTIPLPFGFQAGFTLKFVAKSGLTMVVRNKYSYCLVTKDDAWMVGPKVAWSPMTTYQSNQDAQTMLQNKKNGFTSIAQARKARGKQQMLSLNKFSYNKNRNGWGVGQKWLTKNIGRHATNKGLKNTIQQSTGVQLQATAEFWLEEGTCDDGSYCKLKSETYSWNLIAASVSFFSASARVSYIRVFPLLFDNAAYKALLVADQFNPFTGGGLLTELLLSSYAEGWDRYLVQLKAHVNFIPNLGQIATTTAGRPHASIAKSGSQADWAKASKKMGKVKPTKFSAAKNILTEFLIAVEKATGSGTFTVLREDGKDMPEDPKWKDYHHGTEYWHRRHVSMLDGPKPLLPAVECYNDWKDDSDFQANRFPINSCPENGPANKPVHKDYMSVLGPTRDIQIQIPWTHFAYKSKNKGVRQKLVRYGYNNLDISLSDRDKRRGTAVAGVEYSLLPNRLNYFRLNIDHIPEKTNSYIHGLSDHIEENNPLANPWAVTNANEATGKLTFHKPVSFQIIAQEQCDILGLTSILEMDDAFNSFLGKFIFFTGHPFNDVVNWKTNIKEESFIETTQAPFGSIEEDKVDNIHIMSTRPYGLIASGERMGDKKVLLRQTNRTLYGQQAQTSGMLTKHLDCREDYRCVCLPPTTYAYIKYSKINIEALQKNEQLIMHPVDTYEECKIAEMHEKTEYNENMFQGVEYYLNEMYVGDGVKIINDPTKGAGCIYAGNVVFNMDPDAVFENTDSLVKILKIDRDMDDAYDHDNFGGSYRRFITRKVGLKHNRYPESGFSNGGDCTAVPGNEWGECTISHLRDKERCEMVTGDDGNLGVWTPGCYSKGTLSDPSTIEVKPPYTFPNVSMDNFFIRGSVPSVGDRTKLDGTGTREEMETKCKDKCDGRYIYEWAPIDEFDGEAMCTCVKTSYTGTFETLPLPFTDGFEAKEQECVDHCAQTHASAIFKWDAVSKFSLTGESSCSCTDITLAMTEERVVDHALYQFDIEKCDKDSDSDGICDRDESVKDVVNARLDNEIRDVQTTTEIFLTPNAGHGIGQVQKVYQNDVSGYFAIEPRTLEDGSYASGHQPLKDTQARHILYNKKLHTWRIAKQYLKSNNDRVEKYSTANNGIRVVSYLDMSNHEFSEWNSTKLPEGNVSGTGSYSFVQNIITYKSESGNCTGSSIPCSGDILVPEVDFIGEKKIAFYGKNIPMKQNNCIEPCGVKQVLPDQLPDTWLSCEDSLMLPNRCPAGYGMDGDWIEDGRDKDEYDIPYEYESRRQCALCPVVDTCKEQCDPRDPNRYSDECLQCLSPEGRYRCQIDNNHCDKPGYVWVTTRRSNGRLSTHCVKTDEDPKEEDEWHTTNLQKEYWDRKEPFFPHRWKNGNTWFIRNEPSHTRYLTCNSGYVPVRNTVDSNKGTGTCSGYVCERCPATYIEEDQICKKCGEREVAGHLLGADYNDNECVQLSVPIGHFFDSQNKDGVTDGDVHYPFVSHCDHWLNHPAGASGAYQNEPNQITCKTTNTTYTDFGKHAVIFPGGIVKFDSVPGYRVNTSRTAVVACEEYEVCNGEEITGCKPGYIWGKQTPDRDDPECFPCNNDTTTIIMHDEKDNYEFCDGTHMFRCADASYTDMYTYDGYELKTHNGDLFVGVRDSWQGSNLVSHSFDWNEHTNWNMYPPKDTNGDDLAGDDLATFKDDSWTVAPGDELAYGDSYVKQGLRGIDVYTYDSTFTPTRVSRHNAFNPGAKCYPVKNGHFALPNEWKQRSCEDAAHLCKHRTFHEIKTFKPACDNAEKYLMTNAVKEECYDEIFRWENRKCTPGLLPDGCHKEYCSREGQSNCWCGEEDDFCTMGCVGGVCQEICGDKVCKEYELCYGVFNAQVSFAKCVTKCQSPKSNYCLWKNDEYNVFCRHYNENWRSMQKLDPVPTSPCFDEMPNIPETQCQDVFQEDCFCGRNYLEANSANVCIDRKIKSPCDIKQDDNTCTYSTSEDGTCVCGDKLIDTKEERCYANKGCYTEECNTANGCGAYGSWVQKCDEILGEKEEVSRGCKPDGSETDSQLCTFGTRVYKDYTDITSDATVKCDGSQEQKVVGCKDPIAKNPELNAQVPGKCIY